MNMGDGRDMLSDLCDPLIHHIFSFLPIKCVVATTTLSKRWKDLWISSPVFNIQDWRRQSQFAYHEIIRQEEDVIWYQETVEMVKILDKVLRQSHPSFPEVSLTIQKFRLDYDTFHLSDFIFEWIVTSMMRKIEEFSLHIPTGFWLPPQLFTCETLTVLKIEMAGELLPKEKKSGTLRSAKSFSFPRLKILHLKHMIFVDESLSSQLFSNSPVLEEVMLTNCYMMSKKVLRISVASLKRLSITNSRIYSCKLKIYSPNLQSLTYNGMPEDYVYVDQVFSSIVDAVIDITFEALNKNTKRGKEQQCGLRNLVGGISDVKILHISGSTLLTLYCEDMFTHMPTFRELRRLVVSSKLSLIMSMGLLHLLLTLPNVESVVIAQGFFPIKNYSGLDRYGLPECLLLRLTVVEIGEIDGKQEDLDIINCFLKISPGLQTIRIAFPSSLSQYRRDRVMEKILMLPKGSTCCEINFLA